VKRHLIRKSHRWIGIVTCVFLLVVSLTAIALSHRNLWLAWTLPSVADLNTPTEAARFQLSEANAWATDPFVTGHLMASSDKQLFESFDQGRTWQEVKLFIPAEHIIAIAYSPTTPEKLWVALRDIGVFYSEDNGIIWEEVVDLPPDPVAGERLAQLRVGHADDLYVQTALGIYYLSSATQKWQSFVSTQAASKLDLQTLIWELHTGKFFGTWGVYLYDGVSIALIFLSLSGLVLARRKAPKRVL
jgi:hypothetical protein